jgi:type I restriction enzyme S subunit
MYGVVQPGEHDPNGIPLIRGRDYSNGWRCINDLFRVTPDTERAFARARLRSGDLIITIKGDVGTVAQVIPELDGANISQTNARLAIDDVRALPRFVLHFLQSPLGRVEISKATQGGAQPSLVFGAISSFRLPRPPIEEQQRIVTVLDIWDQAIDQTERLITVKQRRFDAARIRLVETFQSAGKGKNSWAPVNFGEIAEELKQRNTIGHGPEHVMGVIKSEGLVPMRSHVMAADLRRYLIVPPRAIAYNPMRLNIGSIAASKYDQDVLVSPDYVVFRARHGQADPDFLRFLIGTKRWRDHLVTVGSGSVRTRIYFDGLAELVLRVPDISEQKRIGQFLTVIEQDLKATIESASALRAQKRGLMQKLLTGEWRLDKRFDPEVLAPPTLKVGGRS